MERIKQLEDIILTLEVDFMRFRKLKQLAPGVRAQKASLDALKVLESMAKEVEELKAVRDKLPQNKYNVWPAESSVWMTVLIEMRIVGC